MIVSIIRRSPVLVETNTMKKKKSSTMQCCTESSVVVVLNSNDNYYSFSFITDHDEEGSKNKYKTQNTPHERKDANNTSSSLHILICHNIIIQFSAHAVSRHFHAPTPTSSYTVNSLKRHI